MYGSQSTIDGSDEKLVLMPPNPIITAATLGCIGASWAEYARSWTFQVEGLVTPPDGLVTLKS